jgi:predicted Zn-dependent protease
MVQNLLKDDVDNDVVAPHVPSPLALVIHGLLNAERLMDADRECRAALQKDPTQYDLMVCSALIREAFADWAQALRIWNTVKETYVSTAATYCGAARALCALRRAPDADVVLAPALRIYPDDVGILSAYANIASAREDWPEAVSRWEKAAAQFPEDVNVRIGMAMAHFGRGDTAQAEAMLTEARHEFPRTLGLEAAYAALPLRNQNAAESARRWESIFKTFPPSPSLAVSFAAALLGNEKFDEADTILRDALARFPDNINILNMRANGSMMRKDWAQAEKDWRLFDEKAPACPLAVTGLAVAQRQAGRLDDAQNTLQSGLKRFPDTTELERELAVTLTFRRDWPRALPLWASLKRRAPHDKLISLEISDALWKARQDQYAASDVARDNPLFDIPLSLQDGDDVANREAARLRGMFLRFESFGDGCEFGMVQRRFGAEPLSLLRWTNSPIDQVIYGLEVEFRTMGDPDQMTLHVENGEYLISNRNYQLLSHSFIREASEPRDRFFAQQCRRITFLAGKLLGDLRAGEKIFVYKVRDETAVPYLDILSTYVQGYNENNILLCVRLANGSNPAGTVEWAEKGLIVAYISRFSTIDISYDEWVDVCSKVVAAVDKTADIPHCRQLLVDAHE